MIPMFVIPLPAFFNTHFLGVYRCVVRGCVVPGADANNRSSEARRDACVLLLFARMTEIEGDHCSLEADPSPLFSERKQCVVYLQHYVTC